MSDFIINKGCLTKYTGAGGDIVIPKGVTQIGLHAFYSCRGLTSVVIPEGVVSIGSESFARCSNLTSISIPKSVKKIADCAFQLCSKLKSVSIPEGIKIIERKTFSNCSCLNSVSIPGSVTTIGEDAFKGCAELSSVVIPEGVEEIGARAFHDCVKLRKVDIPYSLARLNGFPFEGLLKIQTPEGMELNRKFFIKDGVLINYFGPGGDVIIPQNITAIGENAFRRCGKITSVVIPDSVTNIGDRAFCACDNLSSVTIPNGVTDIGKEAFCECYSLTSVTIPNSVTNIGEAAFFRCRSLVSISIPGSVKSIGNFAFRECGALAAVELYEGIECIGGWSFDRCPILASVAIPNSIARIPEYPFDDGIRIETTGSTILTNEFFIKNTVLLNYFGPGRYLRNPNEHVTIPDGVTRIAEEVFSDCPRVASVTIPSSVMEIGEKAFWNCENLNQINLHTSSVKIGDLAFCRCSLTRADFRTIAEDEGDAFFNRIGLGDANGCIIKDGVLIWYNGPRTCAVISEGVHTIPDETIPFPRVNAWHLPESLTLIQKQTMQDMYSRKIKKINLPSRYLQTVEELPMPFTGKLLSEYWEDQATTLDYAYVYLYQRGNAMQNISIANLQKNPADSAKCLISLLKKNSTESMANKVAAFVSGYAKHVSADVIQQLYDIVASAKTKKAVKILTPLLSKEISTQTPEYILNLQKTFNEFELNRTWTNARCRKRLKMDKIFLTDGMTPAPEFVVKCALAPYLDMYEGETTISAVADDAAKLLDRESMCNALKAGFEKDESAHILLIPYFRYASGKEVSSTISDISKFGNKKRVSILSKALLLSDSRDALLYLQQQDKKDSRSFYGPAPWRMAAYADIRNMDTETLQDKILCEFGLDAHGQKTYDLGAKTVTVTLSKDLSLVLYDNDVKKIIKSIPKKGVDPEKATEASEHFSDMKKNIKKVVKSRVDQLFSEFLFEKARTATAWTGSYTTNPLLQTVAQLIVWKQGNKTFLLDTDGKPVDSKGNAYSITEEPISVAHPLEMESSDIVCWQEYFRNNSLKQPFAQLWEPKYDLSQIGSDRYRGSKIPGIFFIHAEKHGIKAVYSTHYSKGYPMGTDVDYEFQDSYLQLEGSPYWVEEMSKDCQFTLGAFRVTVQSRAANHIVYLLDKWTIQERIRKDDVSAIDMMENMTAAQVMELLNHAIESNAPNCTAALLELKNRKYPDYSQEMEFLL